MTRIAFIGLGVMGGPMARHLKQAGHELTVYNRSRAKAENWVATYGGTLALSPADAAKDAEVVISCVGTDDDLAGHWFVNHHHQRCVARCALWACASEQ